MTKDLLAPVLAHIDAGLDHSVERLIDVLRIPSISTDPKYAADIRRAAEWMAGQLTGIGFNAAVREARKHPMVVGHFKGPEGAPHCFTTAITTFSQRIPMNFGIMIHLSRRSSRQSRASASLLAGLWTTRARL